MPNPAEFVQYGLAAFALVVYLYTVREFLKFLGNHMSSNTEVLRNLVEVVAGLKEEVRHK